MGAPIDQRLEKMLALSDKRGMIVNTIRVRGTEIEITYVTGKLKTDDADLIDWARK